MWVSFHSSACKGRKIFKNLKISALSRIFARGCSVTVRDGERQLQVATGIGTSLQDTENSSSKKALNILQPQKCIEHSVLSQYIDHSAVTSQKGIELSATSQKGIEHSAKSAYSDIEEVAHWNSMNVFRLPSHSKTDHFISVQGDTSREVSNSDCIISQKRGVAAHSTQLPLVCWISEWIPKEMTWIYNAPHSNHFILPTCWLPPILKCNLTPGFMFMKFQFHGLFMGPSCSYPPNAHRKYGALTSLSTNTSAHGEALFMNIAIFL